MNNSSIFIILFLFIITKVISQPTIISFAPASGPIGTEVIINGNNFSPNAIDNIVYFGATKAVVTAASSTSLNVTVPFGATYQPITVLVASEGLLNYSRKPFLVTFDGPQNIDANTLVHKGIFGGASTAAVGDLDNDGKVDLIVINRIPTSNTIVLSVLRNISTGAGSIRFAERVDFQIEFQPRIILVGDLDGDGKLDLATINSYSRNSIFVFRNTSDGIGDINFAEKDEFPTGRDPRSGFIGDLDRDGKADLVVTNNNENSISYLRNTSSGHGIINFADKVDFATDRNPHYVSICDLNGDYRDDLIFRNGVDSISVLQNNQDGETLNFLPKIDFKSSQAIRSVTLGDFDGDEKIDFLTGSQVFRNITNSDNNTPGHSLINFDNAANLYTGEYPAVGDFNGDGKLDIAIGNNKSFTLLQNTSELYNINFVSKVSYSIGDVANSLLAVDLDGDGKPDLVVVDGSVISIFRNITLSTSGPNITSFNPDSGSAGTSVIITGTNFSSNIANNVVKFNGMLAMVVASSPTSITVLVPEGVTTGPITVTVDGLSTASTNDFIICTAPEQPIITITDIDSPTPILNSSSYTGNQWFLDGVPISDGISNTLAVTAPGSYTVQVSVPGGCISKMSEPYLIAITGDLRTLNSDLFRVYPNPALETVIFETTIQETKTVYLFDTGGKLLEVCQFTNSTLEVDFRKFPPGLYVYFIDGGKEVFSGRLQKK